MTKTYNWYDDDDDSEFEILHTHGSCKISAGCFEGDRLEKKNMNYLIPGTDYMTDL